VTQPLPKTTALISSLDPGVNFTNKTDVIRYGFQASGISWFGHSLFSIPCVEEMWGLRMGVEWGRNRLELPRSGWKFPGEGGDGDGVRRRLPVGLPFSPALPPCFLA
jgi:hypothetical protein